MHRLKYDSYKKKVEDKFPNITLHNLPNTHKWASDSVKFTCNIHGMQEKGNIYKLLNSTGCPKCSTKNINNKRHEKAKKDFITKANVLHGDTYDYSKTEYTGNRNSVIIECKYHGLFMQRASDHLSGAGCPKCGRIATAKKKTTTFADFVKKANEIHAYLYSYNKNSFKDVSSKVEIICKRHGVFSQEGYSHLKGCGCPSCAITGFDLSKPAILYYLKINGGEAYKIGVTNKTIKERFSNSELQVIEVIKTWYYPIGKDCYEEEQRIIKEYSKYRYLGEPLLHTGNTELFYKDILEGINGNSTK